LELIEEVVQGFLGAGRIIYAGRIGFARSSTFLAATYDCLTATYDYRFNCKV
jgi:hypothetical protein